MKTYEQLENEKFVFVDNKFFTKEYQEQYGIESILILALIQKNLLVRGQYIFNLQYLFDVLGVKSNNSTQQKKIKDCLVQLQKDNIISCDVDIFKINNGQLVHVDIDIPETNYTVAYDFELDAIVNCKKENVYNLFNLFTFLKYRIGLKGYCYWNQTDIAYSIGLKSRKVVSRMVDVLEKELELILTDNVGTKKFKDGSVKESNNMYALNYEGSKELLQMKKEEYKEELKQDGIRITNNKTANDKRKLKGRVNYLRNLYHGYYDENISDDEVEELRQKEEEYWELIKNDEDLVEKRIDEFVLFNPVVTKEMTTEPKKHFGKPNPFEGLVNTETGEIIEDDWDEENIEITDSYSNAPESDTTTNSKEKSTIDVLSHFGNLKEVNKDNKKKVERTVDEIIKEYCKITEFDYDVVKNFISNIELDDSFYNADKEEQRDAIKEILMNYQYEIEIMQMNKIEQKRKEDEKERSIANYVPESIRYTQEQEFHNDDEDEFLDLMS